MIRRFRTAFLENEARLQYWLNEMAEFPEDAPARRHHATRQLKIEHVQLYRFDRSPPDGGPLNLILAVISRLEDEDEG